MRGAGFHDFRDDVSSPVMFFETNRVRPRCYHTNSAQIGRVLNPQRKKGFSAVVNKNRPPYAAHSALL